MDEPLSSLVLRLHAELGFTLLYVTHRGEETADIGSRVISMRQGKLVS